MYSSKENSSILWVKLNSIEKFSFQFKKNWIGQIEKFQVTIFSNYAIFNMRLLFPNLRIWVSITGSHGLNWIWAFTSSFLISILNLFKICKIYGKSFVNVSYFCFLPLIFSHITNSSISILNIKHLHIKYINIIYTFYIFNISVISRDILKYISAIII